MAKTPTFPEIAELYLAERVVTPTHAANVRRIAARVKGITADEVNKFLQARGIEIVRNLIGDYITSLEMQGMSITLLKMDDDLLKLWDAPVKTAGMRWGV